METRAQFGAVPRAVIVLVTLALMTALTAGAIAIGSGVTTSSPNGRILFKHTSGDLWTVQPDGSDAQVLVDVEGEVDPGVWSPDGTKLAYWTELDGAKDLVVTRDDGTDPVIVASDVGEVTSWGAADWSPDGSQLAWTARSPDDPGCLGVDATICGGRVFVAAADGSTGAVQTGDPDLDAREAAWSPDGSTIAFGGGEVASIRLHVMDADGSNVREVSDLTSDGWALLRLDWSPDGRNVVGTAGSPARDVWSFPVDGGAARIVSGQAVSESGWRQHPAYAADGAIAWHGGASCPCLALREVDADAVEFAAFTGIPTWSPDGRFIIPEPRGKLNESVIIDRQGQIQAAITDVAASEMSWQAIGG